MKTKNNLLIGILIIVSIIATSLACSSSKDTYVTATDDVTQINKIEKSGALMWGEACNRCHLAPSPADYNDTDWETISLHMRLRANITSEEITMIEKFLKSAN
jgi:hypothetical protein